MGPNVSKEGAEEAPDVAAEQARDRAVDAEASSNTYQKMIEQKENELLQSIYQNYQRIKDVEKELGNVQLQLKLTAGPKKHALELIRRKIETQNEKVSSLRQRYTSAKQVMLKLEEELKKEEEAKDLLCSELSMLVQESATAQFRKLEELKAHLETLSGGSAHGHATSASGAAAAAPAPVPRCDAPAPDATSTADRNDNPFLTSSVEQDDRKRSSGSAGPRQSTAEEEQEREQLAAEAAAARSRHISIKPGASASRSGGAGPTRASQPASGRTPASRLGAEGQAGQLRQIQEDQRNEQNQSGMRGQATGRGQSRDERFSGFDV